MQDIRLNNPQAVRRLLNRTINDLLGDKMEVDKARCIGYIGSILLKAIETEELENRISKLEKEVNKKVV